MMQLVEGWIAHLYKLQKKIPTFPFLIVMFIAFGTGLSTLGYMLFTILGAKWGIKFSHWFFLFKKINQKIRNGIPPVQKNNKGDDTEDVEYEIVE